jgi:malonyl-CoA O-methyltransferase
MMDGARDWVERNTIPGGGIITHSQSRVAYPEVTGYFIPTLLHVGERTLARQYAAWLTEVQSPDGSFGEYSGAGGFAFDTGQVVRGWLAILPQMPELEQPLRRACDWLIATSDLATGRLRVPPPGCAWNLGPRGEVSEGVHLYVLGPLRQAGELICEKRYIRFVEKALGYYLRNTDLFTFARPNHLTHFYAYIQEAFIELGEPDLARKGMATLVPHQQENGFVPAYSDAQWICSTGLAQLSKIWYSLGERDRADKALNALQLLQNATGGFYGSYGVRAEYFPCAEISWAVKFYMDAENLRRESFFDENNHLFPDRLDPNDGRLLAITRAVGDLNGKHIVDAGCGKGRFAAELLKLFPNARIDGVDISRQLLKHVPKDIEVHHSTLHDLPFEDASIDVLYCVETLEHVADPERVITEFSRVIKPDGAIIIIDKNADKWGALETTEWERWFFPHEVDQWLARTCRDHYYEEISYDRQKQPDGLFIAWVGRNIRLQTPAVQMESPGPETTDQELTAHEWHKVIVGNSGPDEIALAARNGSLPPWAETILDLTYPGEMVLELGSGTAEISAFLGIRGRDILLLDYSEENLAFGQAVFHKLHMNITQTILADIKSLLPLPDDSVDVVWSSGVLEHFTAAEIVHVLSESRRVAGRLVVSLVPNARSMAYRIGKFVQERAKLWPYGFEDPKLTMRPFFEQAGFRSVREFTVGAEHSINFLNVPGFESAAESWRSFFASLSQLEKQELAQGYLLCTVGLVKETPRLAVIPGDPPAAYEPY